MNNNKHVRLKLSEIQLYFTMSITTPPLALGFIFLVEENFFTTSSCTEVCFLVEEKF